MNDWIRKTFVLRALKEKRRELNRAVEGGGKERGVRLLE